MPRLFAAINLPERIRDDVTAIYEAIPGARWTEDGKLHFTLRFIGDVDDDDAGRVDSALRTVAFVPFTMRLKSTGFFPPRGKPKVLWCGVARCEELTRLQKRIERALTSRAGLPPEDRKFSPHITIARLTDSPDEKLARFLTANALFETEEFMVSGFALYSSVLRREGAIYTEEAEYRGKRG
jgi:2'-5' RNA ligase